MKNYIIKCFLFLFIILVSYSANSQTIFKFNAIVDIEMSKAGRSSHYYYNEIDTSKTDFRIGVSQINIMGQLRLNSKWSINMRLALERNKGRSLSKFRAPQLNIHWLSSKRNYGFTVGSFTNPFGSFNDKQLSTKRNFVGLPLAYSYYTNISEKIGYAPDMGDKNKIRIDGGLQWGSSMLYYGGYTAGIMFSWNIKPSKINWKIALVNTASNRESKFAKPENWGFISRLKLQPTYYWEQGISISHGTFMEESGVSEQLEDLREYSQTLIGTDFKLGSGFFEFSGELIGAFYQVPHFNSDTYVFESDKDNNPLKISSFSAYLDIKYELPILQGSYIAYRIDHLGFSKLDANPSQNWDNRVQRHSLALGYHINKYMLARVSASTQHVDNKSWDKTQRTFRFVLTAHY